MQIRSLEEPKLEPERIRSFTFCQSIKNSARQAGFIFTFYHATVKKCLSDGQPTRNTVISTLKV